MNYLDYLVKIDDEYITDIVDEKPWTSPLQKEATRFSRDMAYELAKEHKGKPFRLKAKTRPDYIKCISHTHADMKGLFWCGRKDSNMEFAFTDIDHATYNAMNFGRLVACPDCLKRIRTTFIAHTE